MICRRPIAEAFWGPIAENPGFVEGHTFEGNPISCAAGIAVLREILERDLLANARVQGRAAPRPVRGAGAEVSGHRRHPRQGALPGDRVRARPRDEARGSRTRWRSASRSAAGRWRTACSAGSTPTGSPSARRLIVTAEQIDEMVAILDRSLGEVLGELKLDGAA